MSECKHGTIKGLCSICDRDSHIEQLKSYLEALTDTNQQSCKEIDKLMQSDINMGLGTGWKVVSLSGHAAGFPDTIDVSSEDRAAIPIKPKDK